MLLYIRNKSATAFVDDYLGIFIPPKVGSDEGLITLDTNDLEGLLRNGSSLFTLLTTGTVTISSTIFSYGDTPANNGIYLSTNGSATGQELVDIGALGATPLAKATIAYRKALNLDSANVFYDPTGTGMVSQTVQSVINELDTRLDTLSSISGTIEWRPGVLAITADGQLSGTANIPVGSLSLPFGDDNSPASVTLGQLVDGVYILYKGAGAANDKLWKIVGTNLVLQVGGLVNGYTFIINTDLTDITNATENSALYVFQNPGNGLTKISDIDWGTDSLQKSYDGGPTIVLTNGVPLAIGPNGVNVSLSGAITTSKLGINGGITVNDSGSAGSVTVSFKDQFLTTAINLSQALATAFVTTKWQASATGGGNTYFDWTRPNSPTAPSSIMGSIFSLRDDLHQFLTTLRTAPVTTNGDLFGANFMFAKGLSGVTPTGGSVGGNANVQSMLEGLNAKIATASMKSYASTAAFTAAKSGGTVSFFIGEIVYIRDINRFVEIITNGTGTVIGTDYAIQGYFNNSIQGLEFNVNVGSIVMLANDIQLQSGNGTALTIQNGTLTELSVTLAANSVLGLPVNTNPLTTFNGATVYDSGTTFQYIYDSTRSKWLSAARQLLQFGGSSVDGQYLSINGVNSGLSGFLIPRNAVITAIAIMSNGNASNNKIKDFEIRANGVQIGTTKTLVSGAGNLGTFSELTSNININAGDYIQIFASAGGTAAQNVIATIEISFRK